MNPVQRDIVLRRNAPFIEEWSFDVDGETLNLSGWRGTLQIRMYGAAPGSALIRLVPVTGEGSQGLLFRADEPDTIRVLIDKGSINALPPAAEPGGSLKLVYDLILTDPSGFRWPFQEGRATILPGVSQP